VQLRAHGSGASQEAIGAARAEYMAEMRGDAQSSDDDEEDGGDDATEHKGTAVMAASAPPRAAASASAPRASAGSAAAIRATPRPRIAVMPPNPLARFRLGMPPVSPPLDDADRMRLVAGAASARAHELATAEEELTAGARAAARNDALTRHPRGPPPMGPPAT